MRFYVKQRSRVRRPQVRAKAVRLERMHLVAGLVFFLLLALSLPSRGDVVTLQEMRTSEVVSSLGFKSTDQEARFQQGLRAYDLEEYALAYRIWLPLALQGNREAQFYMGMFYDAGQGVAIDPKQSVYWYELAARAGHGHAQHNLGVAYAEGEGVEVDIHKALKWWSRSAHQGNTDAQYNLGVVYAVGRDDVHPNILKAIKWWRMAANNGDAMAQYNLGTIYADGDGAFQSACEAVRWWEKSARSGLPEAAVALQLVMGREDFAECW